MTKSSSTRRISSQCSSRRVLLAVPAGAGWGRAIVAGATAYAHERYPAWELLFRAVSGSDATEIFQADSLDGILLHPATHEYITEARRYQCPVILVGDVMELADWPCVSEDNRLAGRMAYEYFASKGYQQYAFWGEHRYASNRKREEGFFKEALQSGNRIYPMADSLFASSPSPPADLEDWLASLDLPVGLLIGDCNLSVTVSYACRRLGLRIPEDVALLSVNNEELLCNLANPPLSSVEQDFPQVGYRAARMLDDWMQGREPTTKTELVPPLGVVERQSTDTLAISDSQTAKALRFIRDHVLEDIQPADVLDHVLAARTTLEQKFKQHIGRTIFQEILRLRMEHAKRLLRETDLKIDRIARLCCFCDGAYFTSVFRKQTSVSPSAYRRGRR
jgi:LacI family transcriptional regulator